MELTIYISLTAIGIFTKLWTLGIIRRHWKPSVQFLLVSSFAMIFLLQSTFELMLYFFSKDALAGRTALVGYYVCAVICISILPFMIAKLTRHTLYKYIFHTVILCNIIVCYLLLGTDLIIKDVAHTGIALTRVAGEHYWVFQALVVSCIIFTLYILITSYKSSNGFIKIRTNNILIVFCLAATFSISIIVAMQFIEGMNAVGLLPLFVAIFVLGIVDNICSKHILDYEYWLPFSKKRREINKLIKPFIEIQSDGLDPELKKEYNKMIAQHALKLFNGNQTKAAEWLNVSQSWVSRNNKNN